MRASASVRAIVICSATILLFGGDAIRLGAQHDTAAIIRDFEIHWAKG
jgi:hypothetical protein